MRTPLPFLFFFFNDTATTEIYTLSLHDALPISAGLPSTVTRGFDDDPRHAFPNNNFDAQNLRSEEHTSELQSRLHLVCRLLLEKKKKIGHQQFQQPRARLTIPVEQQVGMDVLPA